MLLFVSTSALGIYALGNGLAGLLQPGKGIQWAWLAVLAVTLWILFAQMGRVHDSWPRRGLPKPEEADGFADNERAPSSL
jgi:hypothetical protein